jgi:MFS family permease
MPRLRAANIVIALLYSGVFSMWFFLTLYMQQVLGYSALRAGLAFMPMTLSVALAASFAPRLVARFGVRPVLATGMLSSAIGLGLLTGVAPGGSYLGTVLPGGVLGAGGLGLALVPATIAAVQGISAEQSGLASGLLNTSRLVGGALGLAVLSTIADSHTSGQLTHGASTLGALTSGYQLALGIGALISLLGALLTVLLLRPRASEAALEATVAPEATAASERVATIPARRPDEARAA